MSSWVDTVMKIAILFALIPLGACAATAGPGTDAVERERAESPGPASGAAAAEREFESARGREAAERVQAASSSVIAIFYQGLPRPITGADGRVTFAGPAVNAVMREDGRWLGWKTGRAEPVPSEVGARLDSILADPALWREPEDFPRGGCTDAGSLQLAIRHEGRFKSSRQDNCDSRGFAGALGRMVLDEKPEPSPR